jgi:hypothetical protein
VRIPHSWSPSKSVAGSTYWYVQRRDGCTPEVYIGGEWSELLHAIVYLPQLSAAARPLPGLGYLLEESAEAAILSGAGILVRVPDPAAYALHKLWLAERRNVAEQAKARKDRRQAAQIIDVLLTDRAADLRNAWKGLPAKMAPPVRRSAAAIDIDLRRALGEAVHDAALSRR